MIRNLTTQWSVDWRIVWSRNASKGLLAVGWAVSLQAQSWPPCCRDTHFWSFANSVHTQALEAHYLFTATVYNPQTWSIWLFLSFFPSVGQVPTQPLSVILKSCQPGDSADCGNRHSQSHHRFWRGRRRKCKNLRFDFFFFKCQCAPF